MAKDLILIHGRDFKPSENVLKKLWVGALRYGIERDYPVKLGAFDNATIRFVYYGDLSKAFLEKALKKKYKETEDVAGRKKTSDRLKTLTKNQFNKKNYENLPGMDWKKEALADIFAGILNAVRLSQAAIESVAPDMRMYWNSESQFGSDVRHRMIAPLKKAMDANGEVMVISHSLGTMISYDTFWKFSRMGEYRPKYSGKKIHTWVTLGSPLGNETVKRFLKGSRAGGERVYPSNIENWVNIAAEDDYVSHDQDVANDFKAMKKYGLVRSIKDYRIYNLAVRDGKSNPHHGVGYLIHPRVARVVADWL